MPLFFLTAGLFSAAVLAQPFRVLVHRRVARLLWLYLLWSTVWVAAFAVLPWPRPDVPRPGPAELPLLLVRPNDTTWFVYGARAVLRGHLVARRLPTPVLLGGAALLSVVAALVDTGSTAIDKMGTYYVFFAAAVRLGPRVREVAARVRGWHAVAIALAYAAVAVVVTATGLLWVPGGRLATGALAVVAGVSVAAALSRGGWAPGWSASAGGRCRSTSCTPTSSSGRPPSSPATRGALGDLGPARRAACSRWSPTVLAAGGAPADARRPRALRPAALGRARARGPGWTGRPSRAPGRARWPSGRRRHSVGGWRPRRAGARREGCSRVRDARERRRPALRRGRQDRRGRGPQGRDARVRPPRARPRGRARAQGRRGARRGAGREGQSGG